MIEINTCLFKVVVFDVSLQNHCNYFNVLYRIPNRNREIYYFYSNLHYNFSIIQLYEKHCKKKYNFNIFIIKYNFCCNIFSV